MQNTQWKVAVAASISENRVPAVFHARKNPKQEYLKVVMFSDTSLSKKCIYLYGYDYAYAA